jgi:hypothetical protein
MNYLLPRVLVGHRAGGWRPEKDQPEKASQVRLLTVEGGDTGPDGRGVGELLNDFFSARRHG